MSIENELQGLGHQPNSVDEISSVFGLDDFDDGFTPPGSTPAAAPTPAPTPSAQPAAPEPGAGVAAPSPAPAEPQAQPAPSPVAPTPASAAPALPPLAAPAPGATPPAAPAPAVAPTPEQLELASLRAQVANLTQQQQAPQTPAAAPGQPEAEQPPVYSLAIPDQLATAIFSENPVTAKEGMAHLVNSLATHIHQTVRQEFRQELSQRDQRAQQTQQQTSEQQQAATMQQEYYGEFPTHNNPAIKQIVAFEAQQLQAQYPALSWGPEYRAALGARVNAQLVALASPAPLPTPTPTPAPRPAPFAPTSPRPMVPAGGDDAFSLMDNTMGPDV